MSSKDDSSVTHLNRLANEKSSYLLQHATNPVDWYPWCQEAFDKAKAEDKLIFLSVGYSTCHWCHVMERESFTNETVGQILNENFVAIKVDREERPDVDRVYMTFIQATSGSGGWPMSVWLTPDLKPIVGGTYFPPDDHYYGRPGFVSVLNNIAKQWHLNREKVMEQGTVILEALAQGITISGGSQLPGLECLDKCYTMLSKNYDDDFGGFSREPKFPQAVNFNFMFRFNNLKPSSPGGKQGLEMSLHTLKQMAFGGIRDHIGQGFHRYSTDAHWHVPHFEKMLYDQAQLAYSYIDAYQISKDEFYASIARDILCYTSRDLTNPLGGFYSAEDADSLASSDALEKCEGAFYVWTEDEINKILSDPVEGVTHLHWFDIFKKHYGVQKLGNVDPYKDIHNEFTCQNILFSHGSEADTAADLKLDVPLVLDILEKCRQRLFQVREKRPRPHKDMKILTAWNGLMISAYARAGEVLQDSSYLERAIAALDFIKKYLYLEERKLLLRSCYCEENGDISQIESPILGFAEDYACVIQALLDIYEATLDSKWLEWAEELQIKQNELFLDENNGGYFTTMSDDKSIMLQLKDDQEGAEPSANSISANNLIRLANYFKNSAWEDSAKRLLTLFYERLTKIPITMPQMLCALIPLYVPIKQVIIVGSEEAEDTKKLIQTAHSVYLPNKIIIINDKSKQSFLANKLSEHLPKEMIENKATAYLCNNYSCSLPVTSHEELYKQLQT